MCRHSCEHDDPETYTLPAQTTLQRDNMLSRTMTILYDKIKVNRPLPRLPTSIRSIAMWKTRQHNQSGVYDSIKINNNKATDVGNIQKSLQCEYPYVEANAVVSISGSFIRNDSNYLHPISKNNLKMNVSRQQSVESNNSYISHDALSVGVCKHDYITPSDTTYVNHIPNSNNVSDSSLRNAQASHLDKQDPTTDVYVNVRIEPIVTDGTNDHDRSTVPNTIVDVIEEDNVALGRELAMQDIKQPCVDTLTSDSHYMEMDSNADVNNVKDTAIAKGTDINPSSVKHCLDGIDSTGYVSMNIVDKCNAKSSLQPQDSTFPELVQFTQPLKDVNVINDKRFNDVRQNTSAETNTGNIQKNKRDVKDIVNKMLD